MGKLTELKIKSLPTPKNGLRKHFDGDDLYLVVYPTGRKAWRVKFYFHGKEGLLTLGKYPAITLKEARELTLEAKKMLEKGINPASHKQALLHGENGSFEVIAREWMKVNAAKWKKATSDDILRRLEVNIFPSIGSMSIAEITPADILSALNKVITRGAVETAKRLRQYCSQIFSYAIATSRADYDAAAPLKGAMPATKTRHMPAVININKFKEIYQATLLYHGTETVRNALLFSILTAVRPGNIRFAEWAEISLDEQIWIIPAEKMKAGREHRIPLSVQAVDVLRDQFQRTGKKQYVFEGRKNRPLSENTMNQALKTMGFADEQVAHGFRASFSSIANELSGFSPDVIEGALAHQEKDAVRAAYMRSEFWSARKKLFQWWADLMQKNNKTSIC